ncbi:MAG TPA: type II toxin-antitoxin system VapC family toxin [Geminicoccaceae bacterium]|nr:type II toxin-antitoxin system VapC family toxin [Geminicoccaceae bacterium]
MLIVDTNVISELMRPAPDEGVARWFERQPLDELATTAVSVGEILYGLDLVPDGRRKADLAARFAAALQRAFADRILPFDAAAAAVYARVRGDRDRAGRPVGVNDAMIAAIAHLRGATVATRNVADFEHCGVAIVDPWQA